MASIPYRLFTCVVQLSTLVVQLSTKAGIQSSPDEGPDEGVFYLDAPCSETKCCLIGQIRLNMMIWQHWV